MASEARLASIKAALTLDVEPWMKAGKAAVDSTRRTRVQIEAELNGLRGLKESLHPFTEGLKALMGGGAVAGVTLAAREIGKSVDEMRATWASFNEGKINLGQLIDKAASSIPVFGQLYDMWKTMNPVVAANAREVQMMATAMQTANESGERFTAIMKDARGHQISNLPKPEQIQAKADDQLREDLAKVKAGREAVATAREPLQKAVDYANAGGAWRTEGSVDRELRRFDAANAETLRRLDNEEKAARERFAIAKAEAAEAQHRIDNENKVAAIKSRNARESKAIQKDLDKEKQLTKEILDFRKQEADARERIAHREAGENARLERFKEREFQALRAEEQARQRNRDAVVDRASDLMNASRKQIPLGGLARQGSQEDLRLIAQQAADARTAKLAPEKALALAQKQIDEQKEQTKVLQRLLDATRANAAAVMVLP